VLTRELTIIADTVDPFLSDAVVVRMGGKSAGRGAGTLGVASRPAEEDLADEADRAEAKATVGLVWKRTPHST
jgi:hypothetical protein